MSQPRNVPIHAALLKLEQECSEVIQISTKIQLYGATSYNPEDPNKTTNLELLIGELGDVKACIEVLRDRTTLEITDDQIHRASLRTHQRLLKWFFPFVVG